jgi:hypothetical protein
LSVPGSCLTGQAHGNRVADISYRQMPEMPDATFFDCTRLHAGLSTVACTGMWRAANERRSERYTACRSCFVGATHAGVSNASRSPISGALVCQRCGREATRLIQKRLCVSCKNRGYELIKGRNARGMAPTKLAPLAPRRVFYVTNGRAVVKQMERTTNDAELIVATLRNETHAVAFGWAGAANRAALLEALLAPPGGAPIRGCNDCARGADVKSPVQLTQDPLCNDLPPYGRSP